MRKSKEKGEKFSWGTIMIALNSNRLLTVITEYKNSSASGFKSNLKVSIRAVDSGTSRLLIHSPSDCGGREGERHGPHSTHVRIGSADIELSRCLQPEVSLPSAGLEG